MVLCGSSVFFVFFFNFFFSKEKKRADESDEIFENEKNRRERKIFCFFLKFFSLSFPLFCGCLIIICQA